MTVDGKAPIPRSKEVSFIYATSVKTASKKEKLWVALEKGGMKNHPKAPVIRFFFGFSLFWVQGREEEVEDVPPKI